MKLNVISMKRFFAILALLPMLIFSVACEPLPDDSDDQPDEEIVEEYGPYEDISVVNGKVRFYLMEKKNSTRTATNMTARDWTKSQVVMNGETYDIAMSDEETPRPYVEVAKASSYNATLITSTSNKWYDESTTKGVMVPHSQIYHNAISNIKSFPMYASYSKSVGNKLIFNDGFAMIFVKLRGTAKISSIKVENLSGDAIAGVSNLDAAKGAFEVQKGMDFVALNCTNKGEFVQLTKEKNTNFRLILAPGEYPEGLKISICDSEHGAKFIPSAPMTLAPGQVLTITQNYACEKDLLFYEGFDNFVWGGDIVKGEKGFGFSPTAATMGETSGQSLTGYENAFAEVPYNNPGAGFVQPKVWDEVSGKMVGDVHQLSDSYIASRNLSDWRYLYCVQEHPGYILSGAAESRGLIQLPLMSSFNSIGDVKVYVRFAVQSGFSGRIDLQAQYGGVIKSAKLNGHSVELNSVSNRYDATVAKLSIPVDSKLRTPSSSTAAMPWNDLEVVITGATDGTRLAFQNATIEGSSLRFYIDKFEVRQLNDWKDNSNLRVLLWNVQNGICTDQHNNYDNFVEWIKKWDPDICIWCESESIYEDKSNTSSGNSKYLPDNWDKVAARYGHSYVAVGGNRDNYPQTVTSKFPITVAQRFTTTDDGGLYGAKYILHGSGHFQIEYNGKKINIVTCHPHPQAYAPGTASANQAASAAKFEGNYFREYEIKYLVKKTVNNSKYSDEEYWLFGGDTNSRSPYDKWYHDANNKLDDTYYLPHKHIIENTNLKDVIAERYPKESSHFFTSTYGTARIDILYASPKLFDKITNSIMLMDNWMGNIVRWEYYTSFWDPSDHRPVLVDFNL